jgi:hypothetical protein
MVGDLLVKCLYRRAGNSESENAKDTIDWLCGAELFA